MSAKPKVVHHKKKTISVNEIMKLKLCYEYNKHKISRLFNKRDRIKCVQLLDFAIPTDDILWVFLHFFDTKTLKKIGYAGIRASGDKRPRHIWYRMYYDMLVDEELVNERLSDKCIRYVTFYTVYEICTRYCLYRSDLRKIMKRYMKNRG